MIDEKVKAEISKALDEVRVHLQNDGGDLELVDILQDGTVKVRLQGACRGCPGAAMTLKAGVERILMERVKEVTKVENVA